MLIETGAIGDVRLVKIELYQSSAADAIAASTGNMKDNWRINPEVSGGGYFFDLASHQLDYLDFVFGPIKSVDGYAGNQAGLYSAADIITSSFTFQNGIQGVGSWCFTVDEKAQKDELTIIGTEGKLSISFFGDAEIIIEKSGSNEKEKLTFDLPPHIQHPLIETIVNDLLGKGTCTSTGSSAARTNWVMEEMTKNYYINKA